MSVVDNIPAALIATLRNARQITVLTGAGVSAESGIPTFREAQVGLWSQYDPHQLATPDAFRLNPRLVWEWYTWRRSLVEAASPNPGHYALVEMETCLERSGGKFTLITQNVDGLHQEAGSKNVIELHGNIMRTKCFDENRLVSSWADTDKVPPRCPYCGGLLRPDVVWFGESLPGDALQRATKAAENCDVFLSVGTSTVVEPAASLPFLALKKGVVVIEVNSSETPLTPHVPYHLNGASGILLPALIQKASLGS